MMSFADPMHPAHELDDRELMYIAYHGYRREFAGNIKDRYRWPCKPLREAAIRWAQDYPDIFHADIEDFVKRRHNAQ